MKIRGTILGLILGAWMASANALAKPQDSEVSGWSREPSAADKAAVHPKGPAGDPIAGFAITKCGVEPAGLLADCRVLLEKPPGQGMGAAALKLMPLFQVKAAPKGGTAPSAPIRVDIEFQPPLDTRPDWLKKPTRENMLAVWPTEAAKKGQSGRAVIMCFVNVQGLVYDCVVRHEQPEGAGFGAAAIAMTPQFLMRPATRDGKPVVSVVGIPLAFAQPPQVSRNPAPDTASRPMYNAARDWIEAPTHADLAAAYPEKARAGRVEGHVNLNCAFDKEGRLRSCSTINEEPRGQGFAAAAKALSKQFRADPSLPNGKSLAGAYVQLPVTFTTAMLGGASPTLGKPQWADMPSLEQAGEVYPAAATRAGIKTGRTILSCLVQSEGRLDCKLENEEPANYGFGAAALAIMPHFRTVTWTMEGLPTVGATARVPILFQAESNVAGASPEAGKP